MAWVWLLTAGLFEVGFTTCMRYSESFRNLPWTVGFFVCAYLSFSLLDKASKAIPLGTAYAIWVGIGAVGTLLVGVMLQEEPLGLVRVLLILGLVACIVGLKLTGSH